MKRFRSLSAASVLALAMLLGVRAAAPWQPLALAQTTTTLTGATTTSTTLPGCIGDIECPIGQSCHAGACENDGDNDGLIDGDDPCPLDARNLCYGPVVIEPSSGMPIRLNAVVSATAECAGAKTDCNGDVWQADFGWNIAGKAAKCNLGGGGEGCVISGLAAVFGCEDESTEDLFQCEHFDAAALPELTYSFDVADGEYLINLFFANSSNTTVGIGDRVFDIFVEGELAYDDFDQVASATGSGVALIRSVLATVADGNGLQIELGHVVENPTLKALEILTSTPLPSTTMVPTTSTTIFITTTTLVPPTTTTMPTCLLDTDCDDLDVCTDDSCFGGVCSYVDNNAACSDGIACTTGDMCSSGVCAGIEDCAPSEVCDPFTGLCELTRFFISAATDVTAMFQGAMTTSADFASGTDADPDADSIMPTLVFPDSTVSAFGGGSPDKVTYSITIPKEGTWYLWSRLYYPDPSPNGANSFFAQVDNGPPQAAGFCPSAASRTACGGAHHGAIRS